jgi:molybdopterin-binding protein
MNISIRNHLPGTIEQIVTGKVVSEIVINTAAGPVASIITTGSVKRMKLKEGDAVFAIIKATEVSVEKESSSPSTTARIRRRTNRST